MPNSNRFSIMGILSTAICVFSLMTALINAQHRAFQNNFARQVFQDPNNPRLRFTLVPTFAGPFPVFQQSSEDGGDEGPGQQQPPFASSNHGFHSSEEGRPPPEHFMAGPPVFIPQQQQQPQFNGNGPPSGPGFQVGPPPPPHNNNNNHLQMSQQGNNRFFGRPPSGIRDNFGGPPSTPSTPHFFFTSGPQHGNNGGNFNNHVTFSNPHPNNNINNHPHQNNINNQNQQGTLNNNVPRQTMQFFNPFVSTSPPLFPFQQQQQTQPPRFVPRPEPARPGPNLNGVNRLTSQRLQSATPPTTFPMTFQLQANVQSNPPPRFLPPNPNNGGSSGEFQTHPPPPNFANAPRPPQPPPFTAQQLSPILNHGQSRPNQPIRPQGNVAAARPQFTITNTGNLQESTSGEFNPRPPPQQAPPPPPPPRTEPPPPQQRSVPPPPPPTFSPPLSVSPSRFNSGETIGFIQSSPVVQNPFVFNPQENRPQGPPVFNPQENRPQGPPVSIASSENNFNPNPNPHHPHQDGGSNFPSSAEFPRAPISFFGQGFTDLTPPTTPIHFFTSQDISQGPPQMISVQINGQLASNEDSRENRPTGGATSSETPPVQRPHPQPIQNQQQVDPLTVTSPFVETGQPITNSFPTSAEFPQSQEMAGPHSTDSQQTPSLPSSSPTPFTHHNQKEHTNQQQQTNNQQQQHSSQQQQHSIQQEQHNNQQDQRNNHQQDNTQEQHQNQQHQNQQHQSHQQDFNSEVSIEQPGISGEILTEIPRLVDRTHSSTLSPETAAPPTERSTLPTTPSRPTPSVIATPKSEEVVVRTSPSPPEQSATVRPRPATRQRQRVRKLRPKAQSPSVAAILSNLQKPFPVREDQLQRPQSTRSPESPKITTKLTSSTAAGNGRRPGSGTTRGRRPTRFRRPLSTPSTEANLQDISEKFEPITVSRVPDSSPSRSTGNTHFSQSIDSISTSASSPPVVGTVAKPCNPAACRLPDCFCGGNKFIPGDLKPTEIPQMILLTFDDSVNEINYQFYSSLLSEGRTNPNDCPISATFYVSHEWTDYAKIQTLYALGHEIASHSISHSDGAAFSQDRWLKDIYGQKRILSALGGVKLEDIKGMRSPFLQGGGDKQFAMLYETNFTYDSSIPAHVSSPPIWPYTLDYHMPHDCGIPPCPRKSYPGVWEVPMVMWEDLKGGRCAMADACTNPTDARGVYDMLVKNFKRHYTTNRAPFGMFYHYAWFTHPHQREGFLAFVDAVLKLPDVYFVTNSQMIEWMRHPVPLTQLSSFRPWRCGNPDAQVCTKPHRCSYRFRSDERQFPTCSVCPEKYPWLESYDGLPVTM